MIATIEFRILSCHGQFKNMKTVIHKTVIVPVDVDLKLGLVLLRDGYNLRIVC
jgi:hypothetical protein